MGFSMPADTEEKKTRATEIMTRLQAVQTSGVPDGLAFD
jgi:hypothetical protein